MKYLPFLFCCFFGANCLYSQMVIPNGAIAYYTDGSIFIGKIITEDDLFIAMQVSTGDTISLNKTQIYRLYDSDNIELYPKGRFHNKGKHFWYYDYAIGGGFNGPIVQLEAIYGQRRWDKTAVGIGTGYSFASSWISNLLWVDNFYWTVFGYGKYTPWKRKIRPFASIRLGYGFGLAPDYTGGLYAQPGIGLLFPSKRKAKLVLGISQQIQHTKGQAVDNWTPTGFPSTIDYSLWMKRVAFRIGVEF